MALSFCYILTIILLWCIDESLTDFGKRKDTEVKYCSKATKINVASSCLEKNLEYPLTDEDRSALEKHNLIVTTKACSSDSKLTCINTESSSLIGAGTYGLVVRGRSKSIPFPLAIKFIKLPTKLDTVSFNVKGRYNHIDVNSLKKNQGTERRLREAVALRLLTENEIPFVPKYVDDIETKSYRILAMEFLEGYEELSKIIDTLSSKDLLVVTCQVATIVCNFDRLGLSHDDMHERNILVLRGDVNRAHLIDFGGAQFHGHFTSASNFLKQPINLLGHLKRLVKPNLIDLIQSEEKKHLGQFCSQMEQFVNQNRTSVSYEYQQLFEKHWKITQTKKKLFRCDLGK